ncbi:MAG: hypothetical protein LBV59_23785 [Sphingobacterium sp.]|jgi:hypothetical protein|uniref:hypothetical protein n=1 Tax=Sphingobacterium sp. TaxID=341027 RepID=UPI00284372E6|nr:hypothetical protein [Sphingobacterium sp.]MDR3010969.1 hypothetical protein [Sphingobacterium sp.]
MLDFYTIDDKQPKPDFPEKAGLVFAGQLDEKTFCNLQQKGIIAKRFDYYTDFRLDTALIKQMQQIILSKGLHMDTDIKSLSQILDIANTKQSGLIAYSD